MLRIFFIEDASDKALRSLSGLVVISCFLSVATAQCGVTGIISGGGPCTYEISAVMQLYETNQFVKVANPFPIIDSNTFLNLKLSLINTSREANNLLVEICWATPTTDSVNLNTTIVDFPGCAPSPYQSVTVISNNSLSSDVFITFPTFYLYPDDSQIYLHCTVGACDNCLEDDCSKFPLPRRSFTRTAAIITLGPINRVLPTTAPTTSTSSNQTAYLIAVIVLACLVLLVIVLIIAYLLYPRCKRHHMEKRHGKDFDSPVLTASHTFTNTCGNKNDESATGDSSEQNGSLYSTVVKKNKPPQEAPEA